MPGYFRQNISSDAEVPRPVVGPLLGTRLARRGPLVAAMRAQDRAATQSRRVVLRADLQGASNWQVPNTNPDAAGTQTHPRRFVARTAARGQFTLTPGCMLELRAVVALSGHCQARNLALDWRDAGSGAEIRLVTTWADGGTSIQRTFSRSLEASGRLYGAAPTAQGGQFSEIGA